MSPLSSSFHLDRPCFVSGDDVQSPEMVNQREFLKLLLENMVICILPLMIITENIDFFFNMGDVTFPFPGLCNLIIRQFESWKLTSTGITRVPNHCISFFQTPLSRKAKPSPCEYLACLFITALYCLVCSLVGLNHYLCWCNETLFFFSFFSSTTCCSYCMLLGSSYPRSHGEQLRTYLP